jgi:hypothetical protein
MSETEDLVRRHFEAIESGDYALLEDLLQPDCELVTAGRTIRGRRNFLSVMQSQGEALKDAFPDLEYTISDIAHSGDTIVTEIVLTGTHTPPSASSGGRDRADQQVDSAPWLRLRQGQGRTGGELAQLLRRLGTTESTGDHCAEIRGRDVYPVGSNRGLGGSALGVRRCIRSRARRTPSVRREAVPSTTRRDDSSDAICSGSLDNGDTKLSRILPPHRAYDGPLVRLHGSQQPALSRMVR